MRGIALTAIRGTATTVPDSVFRRRSEQGTTHGAAAAQRPAPGRTDTKLARLRELGQLCNSGVLEDAGFELQKSQMLNP